MGEGSKSQESSTVTSGYTERGYCMTADLSGNLGVTGSIGSSVEKMGGM